MDIEKMLLLFLKNVWLPHKEEIEKINKRLVSEIEKKKKFHIMLDNLLTQFEIEFGEDELDKFMTRFQNENNMNKNGTDWL